MMRCILVVLDGSGDRSQDLLGGQTPLQAAWTPNLDTLAAKGMNGLYHPYLQGIPMPSETAHFAMFGYERSEFPGRGYIEAVGNDLDVAEGEVVVLCRLCGAREGENEIVLAQRKPDATAEEWTALMESVGTYDEGGIRIRPVFLRKSGGLLVISGLASAAITDSDPVFEGRPLISVEPTDDREESARTAMALRAYLCRAHERLQDHGINRGPGR